MKNWNLTNEYQARWVVQWFHLEQVEGVQRDDDDHFSVVSEPQHELAQEVHHREHRTKAHKGLQTIVPVGCPIAEGEIQSSVVVEDGEDTK